MMILWKEENNICPNQYVIKKSELIANGSSEYSQSIAHRCIFVNKNRMAAGENEKRKGISACGGR